MEVPRNLGKGGWYLRMWCHLVVTAKGQENRTPGLSFIISSLLSDGFAWKTPFPGGKKEVVEEDDKTLSPSEFLGLEKAKI